MSALIWRVLIAVVCVVIILALIPPVLRVIGFNPSGDVLNIIRICIGGLALLYIIKGNPFPPTP